MKILMFGRGVISAAHGWALAGAGRDVEFYVRPGRAQSYGATMELDMLDARRKGRDRRVRETWSPRYREELSANHDFDLIIVSLPHYRLPEAVDFLSTRIGRATVLMLSNMWADPLELISALPREQVTWGAPQGGGGYDPSGRLHATLIGSVLLGTLNDELTERERAVRAAFTQADFRIREQADIRGWYFLHTAGDASLFSQAIQKGAMIDLIGDAAALREAMRIGRELLPLVEARGVDLRRHRSVTLPYRLPARFSGGGLALATKHVDIARRAFELHADPTAAEPRIICHDVLAEAQRLGVPTPRLSTAAAAFRSNEHLHRS